MSFKKVYIITFYFNILVSCYLLQNIKGIFALLKIEHIKFCEKCYGDEFEYPTHYYKTNKEEKNCCGHCSKSNFWLC